MVITVVLKSEVSPCISTNFEWPTFSNMNILYMRTQTLCHRIENKINQQFVWLKVASINISRSTVSDCVPFLVVPFLFDIELRFQLLPSQCKKWVGKQVLLRISDIQNRFRCICFLQFDWLIFLPSCRF
jgi:ACR3 family arsenite efflux pump ArsB